MLNKLHSAAVGAIGAAALVMTAAPALAQHHHHHGGGGPHYSHHSYRHHGARHWYHHGGRRYYGYGWGYDPWGAAAAAGIIGLAAGAIAAGAAQSNNAVAYCEQRYRSYDPRCGT
jgi:hypothetical protein